MFLLVPAHTVVYVWVAICLGQGADLRMAQLMPLPLTISCSSKSRLVSPFWCRLTWVVEMGESIRIDSPGRIDSRCRIVMKNFDLVPQLQCFSYVNHHAARSRHGSHSRASAKAISSCVAMRPAGPAALQHSC